MRVLIIGCGYVGLPLGKQLARAGHEVHGVRRSESSREELLRAGIQPVIADISDPARIGAIGHGWDWVVNLVSSSKGGVGEYERVYVGGTRLLLSQFRDAPPARYLHASSTSVYAQADGSWVDETSPAEPKAQTSQRLLQAESILFQARRDASFPAIVARIAGIYGPGRGHLFKQFLQGEARLHGEGSRWLNMIHLDDLVAALAALLEKGQPGEIYNVADDEPVTERVFFEWLARWLSRPLPASAPEEALAGRKRGQTSKRVANGKLKSATQLALKHPSFREGYGAEILGLGGAFPWGVIKSG